RLEIRTYNYVARLQVAMYHLMLMQEVDGRDHFLDQLGLLAQSQSLGRAGERGPLQILHHKVGDFIVAAEVVNPNNVSMAETGHCARLLHEARTEGRILSIDAPES